MNWLISLLREEDASTAVEYAVMLALILMGVIAGVTSFGQSNGGLWSSNQAAFQAAGFGS